MSFYAALLIHRLKVNVQLKPAHLDDFWPAGTSEAHTMLPVWHSSDMTGKKEKQKNTENVIKMV